MGIQRKDASHQLLYLYIYITFIIPLNTGGGKNFKVLHKTTKTLITYMLKCICYLQI